MFFFNCIFLKKWLYFLHQASERRHYSDPIFKPDETNAACQRVTQSQWRRQGQSPSAQYQHKGGGHLALEIKMGVGPLQMAASVCVCVCVPFPSRHCPSLRPITGRPGQASLIHIPQMIASHPRQAEASLDPPGQRAWWIPLMLARPTGIRKAVGGGGATLNNILSPAPGLAHCCTFPPHPQKPPIHFSLLLYWLGGDIRGAKGTRVGAGLGRAIGTRTIVSQQPPFRVI